MKYGHVNIILHCILESCVSERVLGIAIQYILQSDIIYVVNPIYKCRLGFFGLLKKLLTSKFAVGISPLPSLNRVKRK